MDDVEFYFNTKREYSDKFIGGLEIEKSSNDVE